MIVMHLGERNIDGRWINGGTIEAVAIKAQASAGQGDNRISYLAKTADGTWHYITKKNNPHLKIKIRKEDMIWRMSERGYIAESEEVIV